MSEKKCKKIYRSRKDSKITGLCGGIAEYFNMDPTIVRILWVVISIVPAVPGVILYIIFSILIPKEPIIPDEINIFDEIDI